MSPEQITAMIKAVMALLGINAHVSKDVAEAYDGFKVAFAEELNPPSDEPTDPSGDAGNQ